MTRRHLILPERGVLLVSTDLHGNGADFRRLREIFLAELHRDPETHWALLGDLVHGPNLRIRRSDPELFDYPDESFPIVQGVSELRERHPDRVHLILGNHDHGHVGGPHTSKFHSDEVLHLESTLDEAELVVLRGLFGEALLCAAAPCGVLLAHGSPSDLLVDLSRLDALSLVPAENGPAGERLLLSILQSYGQPRETSARMLKQVGARHGLELALVIHGHDKDEEGWFVEGENQLCPVLFGAPPANKRYLRLDLAARYRSTAEIRDGVELLRVHPPAS
jgi:hypothetical protein